MNENNLNYLYDLRRNCKNGYADDDYAYGYGFAFGFNEYINYKKQKLIIEIVKKEENDNINCSN